LYLAETYGGHTKNIAGQTTDTVQSAREDNHLQSAERCFKTLIERFANYTSTDDLLDSINNIYRDADQDSELKDWFRKLDAYIRKCLKEQGYILTDDANGEYHRLYDQGNFLLRERYRDHTDRIIDEFKFLGDQFAADPQSQRFGNSVQQLLDDLGTDQTGKPVFKKHLVKDLTTVILPNLAESIGYVPVPRIEYSNPKMDAVVENLVVDADNFIPNVLEVGNDSYFRWGRKNVTTKNKQQFMISVSGIQCDLKDVSYYVNKKKGFPSLKDIGVVDVSMGGEGFSFKLKVASADKTDRQRFFKVNKVDVNVKHMNVKLKQSKHKILFSLFKPLLLSILRPVLQKALEVQIRKVFADLDTKFYEVRKEVEQMQEDLRQNPDPDLAKTIFQQYYEAAQKTVLVKKEKAEEKTADKQAKVVMTKEDSMFKDISLPGGISTMATEYKELARQGDKWESPVFALGSASESGNLPKPVEVTRKPHNTNRANRGARDSGFDLDGASNAPGDGDQGQQTSSYGGQQLPSGGGKPPYDAGNDQAQHGDNISANVRGQLAQATH